MKRIASILVLAVCIGVLSAQGGDIRRGKVQKLDLDKLTITLKVADKDLDFTLTEETLILGGQGKTHKERMQGFKVGSEVMFKAGAKNGVELITHMKLAGPGGKGQLPKVDLAKLIPLPELGEKEYQGFQGGFYPGGKNTRPEAHEAAGLRLAKEVQPRNADGKPDPAGKIVMLSVGMSNTSQASAGFQKVLAGYKDKNPAFQFVNGAQGGMTAFKIQDPATEIGAKYWGVVDQQLKQAGVTRAQVQVIWIKQADAGPSQGFPKYAKTLEAELTRIVQITC